MFEASLQKGRELGTGMRFMARFLLRLGQLCKYAISISTCRLDKTKPANIYSGVVLEGTKRPVNIYKGAFLTGLANIYSGVLEGTKRPVNIYKGAFATGALLATTASAFSGDTIKVEIFAGGSDLDQFRIITKPRNGYDPFIDYMEVYKPDGGCVDAKEIKNGDDAPKFFYTLRSYKGFNIWADKQNVDVGSSFKVDYVYEGSQCKRIDTYQNYKYVEPGTYNAYFIHVKSAEEKRVIRFPNIKVFALPRSQDIVAVAYTNAAIGQDTGVLRISDKIFGLDPTRENHFMGLYPAALDPNFKNSRGTEIGTRSNFEINCEDDFQPQANCPLFALVDEPEIVTTITGDETKQCEMCKSRGWGDPHIITFDGVKYDVHVKGTLTFLKSLDSGFEIQVQTEAVENHPMRYAVTTGLVVTEDNLPKIQVSMPRFPDATEDVVTMKGCPVQLFVDGVPRDVRTGSGAPGVTVQTKKNRILIEYPSTGLQLDMQVTEWRNTCHFSVDYVLGDCRCGETLVGILGSPNGDWHDDWMEEDGTPVDIPPDDHCRRFECGFNYSKTWCVPEEDSNFDYGDGTDYDTYDECYDDYDEEMEEVVEEPSEECEEKCTINGVLDEGCVIDCEVMGGEAGDEYVEKDEETPTVTFTPNPTAAPVTADPTAAPVTSEPTAAPTVVASADPTAAPVTSEPTAAPTVVASEDPTAAPVTSEPTAAPTVVASADPTAAPVTSEPTAAPTVVASGDPTAAPVTSEPTAAPTVVASEDPTAAPVTSEPTAAPTVVASADPTAAPVTSEPTAAPTVVASGDPTAAPVTSEPTAAPTVVASGDPTAAPVTSDPTAAPTVVASEDPTAAPVTSEPTSAPTTKPQTPAGGKGDPHCKNIVF
eukprot:scaffold2993_cov154-Cylindrotheca_fusiformis.AAC.1